MTIKNYGADEQSNFDVSYTVNGSDPVIETFAGPIGSEEIASYSFTEQADFSELGIYDVLVKTSLSGDGNEN